MGVDIIPITAGDGNFKAILDFKFWLQIVEKRER